MTDDGLWRNRLPEPTPRPTFLLMGSLFAVIGWFLRALWTLFVLLTPLLGVWLGSSLVAFYGLRPELAAAAGVLLFPILPIAWELRSTVTWNRKQTSRNSLGQAPKRWLTGFERLVLRTLALNLAFLGGLLGYFPKVAFAALATRGDWFLLGKQDDTSQQLRTALHEGATGLEWLHRLANPNPYKQPGDDVPVPDTVKPLDDKQPTYPIRRWPKNPEKMLPEKPQPDRTAQPEPDPDLSVGGAPEWRVGDTRWPQRSEVHQVVRAMTEADERSIEQVARHIAGRESDPFQRVKALHDWVVTRLHYDHDSVRKGHRKPQDAASVFSRKNGVCEGYARLLVALGQHSGDRFVYVTGDTREESGDKAPVGHAWNAVEILGKWYIIDATWDDPTISGGEDNYRTDYLFIPPTLAIYDHRPEDDKWQMLKRPLSRGDFLRQPLTRPGLARVGLELLDPESSRVEVTDNLVVRLANPRGLYVLAHLGSADSDSSERCGVSHSNPLTLQCPVPQSGRYRATLFANTQASGTFDQVATLDVIRR